MLARLQRIFMRNAWRGKRVLVTGGKGFLGRSLVSELLGLGAEVFDPPRNSYDLRSMDNATRLLIDSRPDCVFHLAAKVGGIEENRKYPASFLHDNILMGLNLLKACSERDTMPRVVTVGSVCAYPSRSRPPFKEGDLLNGDPEETNAAYGIAKRTIYRAGVAYRRQFGLDVVHPILANLYGPGQSFDPDKAHVIGGMSARFKDAKDRGLKKVTLWGTGKPEREFLHVEDAAKALIAVADRWKSDLPINIGSGQVIKIVSLAHQIKDIVGFKGEIAWDLSKPDGQMHRLLDTYNARLHLNWSPQVRFDRGLKQTVESMELAHV